MGYRTRRVGNKDRNHDQIKDDLRAVGFFVIDTSALGHGFPDLVVVNRQGRVALLFEVKDVDFHGAEKVKSEVRFMLQMVDPVYRIVTSSEQAIEIMEQVK